MTAPSSSSTSSPGSHPAAGVRIGHFSDLHIGYEAFAARSESGHNQRGEDVVRALHTVVTQVLEEDPPLVVISGDLAETPLVRIPYLLALRRELERLTRPRPDGTTRQVVVIAGNHDVSRHAREGCYLDLYKGMPGLWVVTSGVGTITFDPARNPAAAGADPALAEVLVHAVPHDSLRLLDELPPVRPVEGFANVLVAHGVAPATEIFTRSIGREYTIPKDLLLLPWDYVALGHFHTQGPVHLDDRPRSDRERPSNIWYAGSTETIDWGDAKGRDIITNRGWLSVTLNPGQLPTVARRQHPVRTMVTLPRIDAAGLSPEEVASQLAANATVANIQGAVVRQKVLDIPRDLWALVDTTAARSAADGALNYRIDPVFTRPETTNADGTDDATQVGLGDIATLLTERVEATVPEADRPEVLRIASKLIGDVLGEAAPTEGTDSATGDSSAGDEATGSTPAADATSPADTPPEPEGTDVSAATPEPTTTAGPAAADPADDDLDLDDEATQLVSIPPPPEDPGAAFADLLGDLAADRPVAATADEGTTDPAPTVDEADGAADDSSSDDLPEENVA